jgi:hypothetical protein
MLLQWIGVEVYQMIVAWWQGVDALLCVDVEVYVVIATWWQGKGALLSWPTCSLGCVCSRHILWFPVC